MHIRGTGVITEYLGAGARAAADRLDADGRLNTGRIGRRDDARHRYLVGRRDDVIDRRGELPYPHAIEEVLQADPGVHDVVGIGRDDPILGSVPIAVVIPTGDGARHTPRHALRRRCERQPARPEHPAGFLFVDEFPRAATGKVQRHRLRGRAGVAVA